MKYIQALLFIILFEGVIFAQSNSEFTFAKRVLYKVSFASDTLNPVFREEISELLYNDTVSLYRTINYGIIDSIKQDKIRKDDHTSLSIPFVMQYQTDLNLSILHKPDSIYTFDFIGSAVGERYEYAEGITMDWVLFDDTKTIMGIPCQRAEIIFGGRRWIAWFSSSIPLPLGPYKFRDLPGLIISMHDSSNTWKFDYMGINNFDSKKVYVYKYLSKPIIRTTKKEFLAKKKYVRDNAYMIFLTQEDNSGGKISNKLKNEIKERYDKRAKADNNWIEFYP